MSEDSSASISQITSSLLPCGPWHRSDDSRELCKWFVFIPLQCMILWFWLALVWISVCSPAAYLFKSWRLWLFMCTPWTLKPGKNNLVEFVWQWMLHPIWPGNTEWRMALTILNIGFVVLVAAICTWDRFWNVRSCGWSFLIYVHLDVWFARGWKCEEIKWVRRFSWQNKLLAVSGLAHNMPTIYLYPCLWWL